MSFYINGTWNHEETGLSLHFKYIQGVSKPVTAVKQEIRLNSKEIHFPNKNHLGIFTGLNSGQSHAKSSVKLPERYFKSDISRNIECMFFDTRCLNFYQVIEQLFFGVRIMGECLWNTYRQWNMEYGNFHQDSCHIINNVTLTLLIHRHMYITIH